MLDEHGDLAIALLAFWPLAFLLAVACCFRQGFGRQSAWLSIGILGVVRIISGACTVSYQTQSNPDRGLETAATITGSLGISFLLSALAGTQIRLFETMKRDSFIPPRLIRVIYLVITAGIVVGIVGATKIEGKNATQDDIDKGYDLLKASSILYLVVFLAVLALAVISWTIFHDLAESQRPLLWGITLSMPFVFVRLLFTLLSVFDQGSTFNLLDPNVWTQAFMQVLEEFIIAIIFLALGFIVQRPYEKAQRAEV